MITVFYMIVFSAGKAFAKGAEIITGRQNGRQEYASIGKTWRIAGLLLMSVGSLFWFLLHYLAPFLLALIIQNEGVLAASLDYLTFRSYGLVFALLAEGILAFFIGIKETKVIAWYTFLKITFNLTLNYWLILGSEGVPGMGIKGAALASSLADIGGLILLTVYIIGQRNQYARFQLWKNSFHRVSGIFRQLVHFSLPLVLQSGMAYGGYFLFFNYIEKLGVQAAATASIGSMLAEIAFVPSRAFALVASSLVSNGVGEGKDKSALKRLMNVVAAYSFRFTFLIAAFILFSVIFMVQFTEVIILSMSDAVEITFSVLLSALIGAYAIIYYRGLLSIGATMRTMQSVVFSTIFCHGVLAYLLVYFKWNVPFVWLAEVLYWVMIWWFVNYWYKREDIRYS